MAKPLGPSRTSRNSHRLTLRLKSFANGWPVIPAAAKARLLKNWPRLAISEKAIRDWDNPKSGTRDLPGTGVRVEGLMLVIDLDITIPELMERLRERLRARWPELRGALVRSSGGVKLALFLQVSEPVGFRHTARYGDGDHVEVYGSLATHYFAIEGPHSTAGRVYSWIGPAPWDVTLASLPLFPAADIGPLIDICDEELGRDLPRIEGTTQKHTEQTVYDLEPGGVFILTDGTEIELTELEKDLGPGEYERGLLDRKAWEASERKDHCKAFIGDFNGGRLVITDFMEGVSHRWKADETTHVELDDATRATLEALRDATAGSDDTESPPPVDEIPRSDDPKETCAQAVLWLLRNVAFFAHAFKGRGGAVSIHPEGEFFQPVSIASLRGRFANYGYLEKGPQGGLKRINPVDAWSVHPEQIAVAGARTRPELPRPLFEEGGLLLINRYASPAHPAIGGSIEVWQRNMLRIIPEPRERAWADNWFALLVQQPHWRMIALAMVARDNGAGRGLLAEALGLVLGERFVVGMPYANISGGSKFNAEVIDRLLVYVNEAKPPDGTKYRSKNAAREALKVFVEPNHRIPFRVEPKGVDAYYTRAAVSTLILSNNIDALPIDEADRRFAVVMNGPQMSVEERDEFQAWMARPENIGALYRHLRDFPVEQDRSVFDPYMAPKFRGRDEMIEAGKTPIDRAWEAAAAQLASAAEVYTMDQIVTLARHYGRARHSDFDDLIEAHTITHGVRIGVKNSTHYLVTYRGQRERVYTHSEGAWKRWTFADNHKLIKELDQAQKAVEAPLKAFNRSFRSIDGGLKDE